MNLLKTEGSEKSLPGPRKTSHGSHSFVDLQNYDLNKEVDRLRTFVENGCEIKNIKILAIVGFYLVQRTDVVKCQFCFVVQIGSDIVNNVISNHLEVSPNCPLLRRRTTLNQPISKAELDEILPPASYNVCGTRSMDESYEVPASSRRRSKIVSSEFDIKNPEYKLYCVRLKTFNSWPRGIKQRPDEIADAGFFYSGKGDEIVCFSCGLGMCQLEPEDNLWVEHKRLLIHDCSYLELNREILTFHQNKYQDYMDPKDPNNIELENLSEIINNVINYHLRVSPNCPLPRRRTTLNQPISEAELDEILPPASYNVCGTRSMDESYEVPASSRRRSKIVSSEFDIKYPEYELYCDRVKTFYSWPRGIKQRPDEIAEAGFFYFGKGDEIVCFSCGLGMCQLEPEDNLWVEHKRLLIHDCSYLELNREILIFHQNKCQDYMDSKDPNNIELENLSDIINNVINYHLRVSPNCPLPRRRTTLNQPISEAELDEILPPASYNVCGTRSMDESYEVPASSRRRSKIVSSEFDIKYPKYKLYCDRVKTFYRWPRGIKQRPDELADAGFFYFGIADEIVCFSCGLGLCQLEPEDNLWVEHKRLLIHDCSYLELHREILTFHQNKYQDYMDPKDPNNIELENLSDIINNVINYHLEVSPNCPLPRRRTTLNQPISEAELDEILPPASYNVCGTRSIDESYEVPASSRRRSRIVSRSEFDIKYPEYKLYCDRVKTFNRWPRGIKQKPEQIAQAGFFYSGKGDEIVCFSCGLGMCQLEPEDNLWVEHKRLIHACFYLELNREILIYHQNKYQDYIDSKDSNNIELEQYNDYENEATSSSSSIETKCKICLDRKVNIVFLPCKHAAVCSQCVFGLGEKCPICRENIKEKIPLFFS